MMLSASVDSRCVLRSCTVFMSMSVYASVLVSMRVCVRVIVCVSVFDCFCELCAIDVLVQYVTAAVQTKKTKRSRQHDLHDHVKALMPL